MPISSKYNPSKVEDKWYQYWMEQDFFHSEPDDRKPYTIVIPPPNVTGVLHMGHMLNNTIQDVLVRRARLQGKNACWVPGTDHASIATEAKVVAKLESEGIDKNKLSRSEFLKHAWEWKEKHGGIILEQLKKLGASCDWRRTKFTMDEDLSQSVIKVFIDLYKKGYIYRGVRMVNWDPQAQTAVSNEEVVHKEDKSKLYYIRYAIEGIENEFVTIATTRPETILGDTAVCINPNDERYRHLSGKKCLVPLINRVVPIIEDDYVDMEFGTGCLKITPAHDENDYKIGLDHQLKIIDIFTDDGRLSEGAEILIGEDRFIARDKILPLLKKAGNLIKTEDYTNKIGYSERTDVVIEPKLSQQWFLKMDALAKPALENVLNDNIRFYPSKFKNVYRHWMENIRDWCISRQLWWGHRIPVYYLNDGSFVVAGSVNEALELAKEQSGDDNLTTKDLKQDEDVLDTWFSSWLWPISVFDGIRYPDNKDIQYYYPTNDLITGHDIIFFWIARMIMVGYEFRKNYPFKNVYFTGMVRDKKGRKMSKQLGNSPDPLVMMKEHGADAVRVGMLLCSAAGNDLLFDTDLILQGRNFANKIWNIFRLIKSWNVEDKKQEEYAMLAAEWFENRLQEDIARLDNQFSNYRVSEALMTTYTLLKDDFSSWFLEMIKPPFGESIDKISYEKTICFFETILQLLHPFMPFITEEIWQQLKPRKEGESLMVLVFAKPESFDKKVLDDMTMAQEVIVQIRNARVENSIAFKEFFELFTNGKADFLNTLEPLIIKSANISNLTFTDAKPGNAVSFRVKELEFFIPLAQNIDNEEEKAKLAKEIKYAKGFLQTILKKLNNPNFVQHAPVQVVEREQKKKADAEAKLVVLEKRMEEL